MSYYQGRPWRDVERLIFIRIVEPGLRDYIAESSRSVCPQRLSMCPCSGTQLQTKTLITLTAGTHSGEVTQLDVLTEASERRWRWLGSCFLSGLLGSSTILISLSSCPATTAMHLLQRALLKHMQNKPCTGCSQSKDRVLLGGTVVWYIKLFTLCVTINFEYYKEVLR
ncbi:hypothetical protein EV421DRAFT_1797167 [Armillaria borealis]|uniref:Uncharacterized protein n=1 Tax=Armillaria borealis TaxID=47425 RepID=A0AA39MTD8_9AGAR|nr:hypothetical protein EV421DRAFT_1797167 [Armillaria borealis]